MMKIKSILTAFAITVCFGIHTSYAQTQDNDNEKISSLISKKRDYNSRKGFGYRIQLYNGSEVRAKDIGTKFISEFPLIKTHVEYLEPEWKIQVGNFKTTLEADKSLIEITMKFPGAIVIPISK